MPSRPRKKATRAWLPWNVSTALVLLTVVPLFYYKTSVNPYTASPDFNYVDLDAEQGKERSSCQVTPRVVPMAAADEPEPDGEIPEHVQEFDQKGYKLPKYPSSELLMISGTSNATYSRRIAQENTIGRIFEIEHVTPTDFPECILCDQESQNDACHCPPFRMPCSDDIFFHKADGWWCATRRDLFGLKVGLDRRKNEPLPKWVHLMEDQTFVNPVGMMLLLRQLDPDVPYWIGDDWGGFAGGGCGRLVSRGLLKLLLGPPVISTVKHIWPNGTRLLQPKTQLESCFLRQQGGDLCYHHADWAASRCVNEVGVKVLDLGMEQHRGFFSQLTIDGIDAPPHNWFQVQERSFANTLRRTHSIAMHVSTKTMYDLFYNTVVPFYSRFYQTS